MKKSVGGVKIDERKKLRYEILLKESKVKEGEKMREDINKWNRERGRGKWNRVRGRGK